MIQLVEGPLGAGKTYFAVNYLCKFTKFDEMYQEYILDSGTLIISNIEGLRINHWDLNGPRCLGNPKENIKGSYTIEQFFTIENFENIMTKTGKKHVILVIDEAHLYFPSGFSNKDIYAFFAFSRHIGLDIILMTQGIASLSRMFNPLLEFVVKTTPRTKQLFSKLSYKYYDMGGGYLYEKGLSKKALVFNAYKSFRQDEKQKPKNAVMHWVVMCSIFFIVAGFLFKAALSSVAAMGKPKITQEHVKTAPDGTLVLVPPPAPSTVAVSSLAVLPQISSVSTIPVSPGETVDIEKDDIPRVIGLIGDANGKNTKYLLSSGQVTTCKRSLNIGDIYIR